MKPLAVTLSTGVTAHVRFIERGRNVAVTIGWPKSYKPSPVERAAVDHVVMGILGPGHEMTASRYFETSSPLEQMAIVNRFLKAEDN